MKYYRSGKRRAIAVLSAVSVGAATVIGSVSLSRNMDVQAASSRSEGAIHDIFPESYWMLCGQNIPIGRLWRSIPDYPGVTVLHLLIKPMNMKCSLPEI